MIREPRGSFVFVVSLIIVFLFKCLSTSDIFSYAGSSSLKHLNASEFAQISPMIVYCLLPAPEKNPGRCSAPRNHSELFNSFARNFSKHGEQGVTHEALDKILEEINETIGQHLTTKKVGETTRFQGILVFIFVQYM